MMDFLQSLFESTGTPIVAAFALGLMTAISPCPLATNITATAYISKNLSSKRMVLLSGLSYTLGRGVSYSLIGVALYFGASQFKIASFFNTHGEKYLGPVLIIVGLFMLNVIRINFLKGNGFQDRLSEKFVDKGILGAFVIGLVFALAFCPYSGALYFGMLIPMTISSPGGLLLPPVFSLATGIPVILFTILLAYSLTKVARLFNVLTKVEKSMRYVAGSVFVLTGLYYVFIFAGWL
ncbi:MAG: sulfite exporter TauE/SafE family protein [Cyclobacteriaceae bacterium]|nr:sulfite exporter TauE/SafE family protein [Cyclobacteriaceae bacterium]